MTDKQNELITQNINLARYTAGKFKTMPLEPEELPAQAFLGLAKAAAHYRGSRGASFATFAVLVMEREILTAYRREKKHFGLVSLDAPLTDSDGKDATLKDILPALEDTYGYIDSLSAMQSEVKRLSSTERQLLELMVNDPDRRQREYSRMMGVSQSYVSRVMRDIYKKLRG